VKGGSLGKATEKTGEGREKKSPRNVRSWKIPHREYIPFRDKGEKETLNRAKFQQTRPKEKRENKRSSEANKKHSPLRKASSKDL